MRIQEFMAFWLRLYLLRLEACDNAVQEGKGRSHRGQRRARRVVLRAEHADVAATAYPLRLSRKCMYMEQMEGPSAVRS